jgi:hypothetical protein
MDRPTLNRPLRKSQELQSVRRTSVHETTRDRGFVADSMRSGQREPIACRLIRCFFGPLRSSTSSLGKRVDKGAPDVFCDDVTENAAAPQAESMAEAYLSQQH